MKKPIIGITLDSEIPGGYSKFPWYAIRHNYLHSVEFHGGIPFPLFHDKKTIKNINNIIDGLIVTGGNFDINPRLYGENNFNSNNSKDKRTEFEFEICNNFIESNKPILGICGGEQLINVVCGGTLIQDIKAYNKESLEHEQINSRDETSHEVTILKNSKLYNIIKNENIKVNSAHHQAINILGVDIFKSGYSKDKIIESIEHLNHKWCIGVQWHPEFLITKEDNLLFKDFIRVCSLK